MLRSRITRRTLLEKTAFVAAASVAAPYIRGAHAAGKLSMGFWDHWVPGANKASTALVNEWGEKEKVEVAIDYITSQGNKNLLTIAAEAQAKSGHDILAMPRWQPSDHANRGARERHHGRSHRANGEVNHGQVSRQSVDGGSRFRPASAARSRVPARAST